MNIEEFREYCLLKKGVTEELPFGPETLVFKVMGKMFALAPMDSYPFRANLKCEPERAAELREQYEEIQPGYHMNKQQWNTVIIEDGRLPRSLVCELIDHSYDEVVKKLKKSEREALAGME